MRLLQNPNNSEPHQHRNPLEHNKLWNLPKMPNHHIQPTHQKHLPYRIHRKLGKNKQLYPRTTHHPQYQTQPKTKQPKNGDAAMPCCYTYTKSVDRQRLGRGAPTACNKCQNPLAVGDPVVSKPTHGVSRNHRKIYHQQCYEKLYIDR